jgi:hypothetical protein
VIDVRLLQFTSNSKTRTTRNKIKPAHLSVLFAGLPVTRAHSVCCLLNSDYLSTLFQLRHMKSEYDEWQVRK